MQGPDGGAADHRMLYVGLLYTPDKKHTCYLVDFDLKGLTAQLRLYAVAFGLGRADDLPAVTDGGNGMEEASRGASWDGPQFIPTGITRWNACTGSARYRTRATRIGRGSGRARPGRSCGSKAGRP